ncbi:MAG: thioesterase domain-containing protein [Cyanobacteria bacterium J06632_22]
MSNTDVLVSDLLYSARLCNTGYQPPHAAQDDFFWFTSGCQSVRHIRIDHHSAYLLEVGDHCELVFRGQLNLSDFLRQHPQPKLVNAAFGECQLYEFFSEEAERLLCEILAFQESLSVPLHLHGHSLGGALASLVAIHLHQSGHTVSHSTMFGAICPGNQDFNRVQQSLGLDRRTLKVRIASQNEQTSPKLLLKSLQSTATHPQDRRSAIYLSAQENRVTLGLQTSQWTPPQGNRTLATLQRTLSAFNDSNSVQGYIRSLEDLQFGTA